MMKPIRQLYDWEVQYSFSGDCYILLGKCQDDDRKNGYEFADGHLMRTSMLLSVDYVNRIAETANSIYKLLGNGI
jgi:hypothetical protein